ncbi:HAD family hydrolase [Pedobacter fastidiosus]|uniref:HAD-IA family hydrolase n=1 Tax=Pedobacter fastidiosus TaxID=2765361 RepID=A0ABR7KYE1_9SPHI|nr:HAD-IA family hydrolase [Pedobacter fastidiosus]MBC6113106.1 HAD-IA family hydrolase [Pedobacter fastidiosus]
MESKTDITTVFLDIGNVLLTNGWAHESRQLAAEKFNLDFNDFNTRHAIVFETYELGKLTIDEYLDITVFNKPRNFTKEEFRQFMFTQSKPFPKMIELIKSLKERYGLKVVAVSNEARELNAYRIEEFELAKIIDFFVSSTYVHLRKPDVDIYKLALDMAHSKPEETLCIDDLCVFVEVAQSLGIKGICHSSYETTCAELQSLGFKTTS